VAGEQRPALVVGLDRIGLALARGLGRTGVPVVGITWRNDVGARSRYLRELNRVPAASREDALVELLERLTAEGRPVVFVDSDESIETLHRRWSDVARLTDVTFPDDPDLMRRLQRKELLAETARKVDVPVPGTIFASEEQAIRAAGLTPPLLVKPVAGKGFETLFRRKAFVADDVDSAVQAVGRAREAGFETIVQELVPDAHDRIYSLLTYIGKSGRPVASLTGRKVRQLPIHLGSSTVFHVAWHPRVHALGLRLLEAVGYHGFAHVELVDDPRDGELKLIEINTRAPVWLSAATTPSFNIARAAYDDVTGGPSGQERLLTREATWVDLPRDLVQAAQHRDLRPDRFAQPYLRRRRARAVWAFDDPAPGLTQLNQVGRRLLDGATATIRTWHRRAESAR
jgi:predicted ATP-grasp superfamily ATP-dependent carboligase